MTDVDHTEADWQAQSLAGLHAIKLEDVPAFEVILLDDLAAYLMGAGPLAPPYTVEHGSRALSGLFGAVINSAAFRPEQVPAETAPIRLARERLVRGAHDFAAKGPDGLAQLSNRLLPAVLGELESHKERPEEQTRALFYFSFLAIASGPANLIEDTAAAGVIELFSAWDGLLGAGLILPWRPRVGAS